MEDDEERANLEPSDYYSNYWACDDEDIHVPKKTKWELHLAIRKGNVPSAQAILRQHPYILDGYPSLLHASIHWGGTLEIVRLFTTEKSKSHTHYGRTALHVACFTERLREEVFEYVLEECCGSSASVRDLRGNLPLHYACMFLEYRQIRRIWKLHPSALKEVDCEGESPLLLLVRQKAGGTDMLAHSLLVEMLEAWPVATCIPDKHDELPFDDVLRLRRAVGREIFSKFAEATLQVFLAMVELFVDERLSLRSECSEDADECSEFEVSKKDQAMLRGALANLLTEADAGACKSSEELRCASPQILVGRILALEETTRRQHPPHSLVERISKLFLGRPKWRRVLVEDPKFAALVNAWYEVNRAGRRDILIRMCGLAVSSDREINARRLPNSSRKYQGDSSNVSPTVLIRMLEAATLRSVGATFLLLRQMPNQYFSRSRRGGSADASITAPRDDRTDARRLEDNAGMFLFRVFTNRIALAAWDRAEAAITLKKLECPDQKAFFYYASLHRKSYAHDPHEHLDDLVVLQYYRIMLSSWTTN